MSITSQETDELKRALHLVMQMVERLDKRVSLLEDVTGHRSKHHDRVYLTEELDAAEERGQARLEGL